MICENFIKNQAHYIQQIFYI